MQRKGNGNPPQQLRRGGLGSFLLPRPGRGGGLSGQGLLELFVDNGGAGGQADQDPEHVQQRRGAGGRHWGGLGLGGGLGLQIGSQSIVVRVVRGMGKHEGKCRKCGNERKCGKCGNFGEIVQPSLMKRHQIMRGERGSHNPPPKQMYDKGRGGGLRWWSGG